MPDRTSERVLSVSMAQLAVLNGKKETVAIEPTDTVAVDSLAEDVEPETVVRDYKQPEDEVPAPSELQPEAGVKLADMLADNPQDEQQTEIAVDRAMERNQQVERQHYNMRTFVVVASVLLLVCIGGMIYMASLLGKRNNRIKHLY